MSKKAAVDELDLTDDELVEVTKNHGVNRRNVMRAVGIGGVAALLGTGSVAATTGQGQGDSRQPPQIDPEFGYAGSAGERVPPRLSPDHTVAVHTDPGQFYPNPGSPTAIKFGAFHFHKAGLYVEPGDIVKWEFVFPEHMVAAYHPRMGRQQRVPENTPSFGSPVMSQGDFWLYQFNTPGVYDMFCPPHEEYGMAMRVVVGDGNEYITTPPHTRPPEGLSYTLLNLPALTPDAIRGTDSGSVETDDLFNHTIPDSDPVSSIRGKELGNVAVPLSEPVPVSSLSSSSP